LLVVQKEPIYVFVCGVQFDNFIAVTIRTLQLPNNYTLVRNTFINYCSCMSMKWS